MQSCFKECHNNNNISQHQQTSTSSNEQQACEEEIIGVTKKNDIESQAETQNDCAKSTLTPFIDLLKEFDVCFSENNKSAAIASQSTGNRSSDDLRVSAIVIMVFNKSLSCKKFILAFLLNSPTAITLVD